MKAPAFGVGFLWEWQFELWIGDAAEIRTKRVAQAEGIS